MKIIIVGAGVSGLAAAQELTKNNHEVLILEASNYVGGRVRTDNNFVDFPLEDGAEFIHGNKVITQKYLNSRGAIVDGTPLGPSTFVEGELTTGEELFLNPEFKDIPSLFPSEADLKDGDMSVKEWTSHLNITDRAKSYLADRLANIYLARPDEIGIEELIHEDKVDHSGEGDFRILDGYNTVIDTLKKGLEIKMGVPVTKICSTANTLTVYSGEQKFECSKVIITVPISILQKKMIGFEPELPVEKLEAINSIKMGDVIKLHLVFKEAFWPNTSWLFISDLPFLAWWPSNYNRTDTQPVFTAFITNKEAREFSKMSEDKVIDIALTYLEKTFKVKEIRKIFVKGKMISWTNEPWIQGGYSFIPPNAFGSRQELAKPVDNKIFFAGEATAHESNPATVHGAIESGIRAAKEIIKS